MQLYKWRKSILQLTQAHPHLPGSQKLTLIFGMILLFEFSPTVSFNEIGLSLFISPSVFFFEIFFLVFVFFLCVSFTLDGDFSVNLSLCSDIFMSPLMNAYVVVSSNFHLAYLNKTV